MTFDHIFVGYGIGAFYGGALWLFGAPLAAVPIAAAIMGVVLCACAVVADWIDL